MLSSLCMRKIRPIVLVYCKTQTTFEASDMVLEKVRVFVEVDSFECELAQSLSSVGVGC